MTKPASKKAIEEMKVCKGSELTYKSDCQICFETFTDQDEAIMEMPCQHLYHKDCLMDWLTKKNTCPVCRKEVEADEAGIRMDSSSPEGQQQ